MLPRRHCLKNTNNEAALGHATGLRRTTDGDTLLPMAVSVMDSLKMFTSHRLDPCVCSRGRTQETFHSKLLFVQIIFCRGLMSAAHGFHSLSSLLSPNPVFRVLCLFSYSRPVVSSMYSTCFVASVLSALVRFKGTHGLVMSPLLVTLLTLRRIAPVPLVLGSVLLAFFHAALILLGARFFPVVTHLA